AELLARRRSATSEEIAGFWADADADRQRWRTLLGNTADDPAMLGNVVLAIEQLQALTANWRTRRVKAPLTLWWAGREVDAAIGTPPIDARVIEEKTARWRACSSGETVLAGVIDTDHPGIVQHPALFEDLIARLAGPRDEAAPITGPAHG
ncbi:MAG TPA: hypothetical protein VEI25_15475, partial [Paraburkholderia sp.]|nr:hypothetical protein [Paraburkholderia sp.]